MLGSNEHGVALQRRMYVFINICLLSLEKYKKINKNVRKRRLSL